MRLILVLLAVAVLSLGCASTGTYAKAVNGGARVIQEAVCSVPAKAFDVVDLTIDYATSLKSDASEQFSSGDETD